jgi:Na+-transporting NADH:ubiquinone oxidoreductase subunit NqrB
MQKILGDPRHFQILTLSILLSLQVFWADFGPEISLVLLTLASAFLTQAAFSLSLKVPFDFRSPLITALSLTILLKSGVLWALPLAALVAIASKFLIRIDHKHIFNPANIGIVVVLLAFPGDVWVSPGQWGSAAWLGFLLLCLSLLVLFKIPRRDMALLFLGFWSVLLFARALWLGDPLAIPVHQLQSGALLIFAFFMISDPKTIPDRFVGRVIFGLAVAVLAFILTFEFRIREGLFYALACMCLLRPILEKFFPGELYHWTIKGEKP